MRNSNWGTDEEIWQTISPPFIPIAQDVALIHQACPPELLAPGATPRILVLGVTPALIGAHWPEQGELHAVDYDQVMIDLLWKPAKGRHCHRAFWQAMPFPDDHFDLVVGDCSLNALAGLERYDEVLSEVDRVRKPGAPLIARFFVRPEPRLTLAGLRNDTAADFAGYRSAAKRLAIVMAAAQDDGGLNLSHVGQRIAQEVGEVDAFLAALGQSPAEIERAKQTYMIDQALNYPSKAQLLDKLEPHFSAVSFADPAYDCGVLCPIVRCA